MWADRQKIAARYAFMQRTYNAFQMTKFLKIFTHIYIYLRTYVRAYIHANAYLNSMEFLLA
jgi:hypothetical protein